MFRKVRVPTLESDRLILRMWTRRDAADLFAYAKDPRVGPAAGWAPHRSIGDSRAIIEDVYVSKLDWAIVDKETGKAIGNIGLDEDPIRRKISSKELGYSLSAAYWGRGIVPEAVERIKDYAFRELEMECITVRAETGNEASKRVMEKCGFLFEGILRHSYKRYDGKIVDMACYSMLATDFFGEEKGKNHASEV